MNKIATIKSFILQGLTKREIIKKLKMSNFSFDNFLYHQKITWMQLKKTTEPDNVVIKRLKEFETIPTLSEAAERLNLKKSKLYSIARKYNFKFAKETFSNKNQERAEKFIRLRNDGWTLEKIAGKEGITRERVRQVIKKWSPIIGGPRSFHEIRAEKDSKRAKKIFNEHFDEYKKLYENWKDSKFIESKLNISAKDVKSLKEMGLEKKLITRFRRRLDGSKSKDEQQRKRNEIYKQILYFREQGLSVKKIALELGVSQPTISNHIFAMKQEGIYVPTGATEGWVKSNSARIELRIEFIIKSINEGKQLKDIAADLGIKYSSLAHFIKKHKVYEKI